MDTISKALTELGLSEKQILIYEALLEMGSGSAHRIAKKVDLKRTTTYSVLNELEEMGLVFTIPHSSKKMYRPLSPTLLIKKQLNKLKLAEKAVPEIEARLQAVGAEEKPRVSYYQGVEGIKNLNRYRWEELAGKKLTVFGATTTQEVLGLFGNFFHQMSKDLVKMNITERGITTDSPEIREYNEQYNEDTSPLFQKKVLPKEIYNPQVSFEFSDEWLKIFDFTNLQGLIIESKNAAQAMEQIFELLWRALDGEDISKDVRK